MRKVIVRKHKQQPDGKWELRDDGEALFHCFGTNYEEFHDGPGNFSTAIIERPDGTIENIPVDHVRFLDTP